MSGGSGFPGGGSTEYGEAMEKGEIRARGTDREGAVIEHRESADLTASRKTVDELVAALDELYRIVYDVQREDDGDKVEDALFRADVIARRYKLAGRA